MHVITSVIRIDRALTELELKPCIPVQQETFFSFFSFWFFWYMFHWCHGLVLLTTDLLTLSLHWGWCELLRFYGQVFFVNLQNSDVHLPITCSLLGIDKEQMQYWLCNRKLVTANEVLTTPLTQSQVTVHLYRCYLYRCWWLMGRHRRFQQWSLSYHYHHQEFVVISIHGVNFIKS